MIAAMPLAVSNKAMARSAWRWLDCVAKLRAGLLIGG
jgi:hypothetical protein